MTGIDLSASVETVLFGLAWISVGNGNGDKNYGLRFSNVR